MTRTANLLRKCRDDLLRRGACSVDDVIRYAKQRYRTELGAERERLLELALRREVKDLMREATGEDADGRGEMTALLPGLDAPLAIAVPTDTGGYRYVPFHAATWDDLLKARAERASNYARAGERLRDFDRKLEVLRRYMQGSNNVTVADACEMMARDVA
ncbi:hypothetical protein [Rhodospirillaceae bacterium SYSU D60014]|uniref:hypothetical protein n=1 Tax=Virgifigura deserti TaxID=2268457 RepID=UPI000E672ABC